MSELRFYWCNDSKIVLLDPGESSAQCREKGLEILVANTQEASTEKHIPILTIKDGNVLVTVGEQLHPMLPEHYIEWILIETKTGFVFEKMQPGSPPTAVFQVEKEKILNAYAYCNLHGLWKADIQSGVEFHETICSAEFRDCIDS